MLSLTHKKSFAMQLVENSLNKALFHNSRPHTLSFDILDEWSHSYCDEIGSISHLLQINAFKINSNQSVNFSAYYFTKPGPDKIQQNSVWFDFHQILEVLVELLLFGKKNLTNFLFL